MSKIFTKEIARSADKILHGRVLAVDPASGATSSPGYAVYLNGELQEYGIIDLGAGKLPVQRRLNMIAECFAADEQRYDVLLIERIRGRMAHEYLKWSVGVIISAVDAGVVIEVPVPVWKSYLKKQGISHVKGDAEDAKIIGESVLSLIKTGA